MDPHLRHCDNVSHCETDSKPYAIYVRATTCYGPLAPGQPMTKTEFLQIRLSPDDKKRVRRAADADHLDPSTWARRVVLKAVDASERAATRKQHRDG